MWIPKGLAQVKINMLDKLGENNVNGFSKLSKIRFSLKYFRGYFLEISSITANL